MLEVRLLGKYEVRRAGKPIPMPSRPAQSLFAFLILNAGTAFRREKLAGQLWPDSTEESARDYLRHALWRIRKALHSASSVSYLHADDLTISFDSSADYWLDAAALKKVSEDASADELIAVLSEYSGELLPGFYDEWVMLEREHLQAVYERKMGRLLDLLQEARRWPEVLEWGEKWIAFGRRPEAAYRALMDAHAANGDRSRVAAVYERLVKSLADFGMEPTEQTQELFKTLKSSKEPLNLQATSVAAPSRSSLASNVPIPLTSFIGREKELREILALTREQRLVTLLGAGGVGKTRLAIECSTRLLGRFGDGVWWVELAGLSDPSLVPHAVAKAVNAGEFPNRPQMETLIDHLQNKQILLVIDNCEHLVMSCAHLADGLLGACTGLKILATSREALGIWGETTWPVPSLAVPDLSEPLDPRALSKFGSIKLFSDRAQSVRTGFELVDQNAGAVVQICRRLDGMPLAIELAAAQVKLMSPREIADRLDDRFDLLTGGSRTALPRHQTLRAAIDWSFDLLSEPERTLFRRLSVFAGGFTLRAAEAVASAGAVSRAQVVALLGLLVNKSLVTTEPTRSDLDTRYRMLETIRQYARELLDGSDEAGEVRERHLDFFAAFAKQAEQGIYSPEQAVWFHRLDQEVDNLRAAMDWPPAAAPKAGAKQQQMQRNQFLIVGSLAMYWERGYRQEITEGLKKMLAVDRSGTPTIEKARALMVGGFLLWSLNNLSDARLYLEESIRIAEKLDDKLIVAWALAYLGWTFDFLGEYDSAKASLEESVEMARSIGDEGKQVVGMSLSLLGDIPYWQGNLVEARALYEESIVFVRGIHNLNTLTYPLRRLGFIELREGNYAEAARLFSESLAINQEIGHMQGMLACLVGFAAIDVAKGRVENAALLCACVEKLLEGIGAPLFFVDTVEYEKYVAQVKQAPDQRGLAAAWAKGRDMALEQALELALRPPKRTRSRESVGKTG